MEKAKEKKNGRRGRIWNRSLLSNIHDCGGREPECLCFCLSAVCLSFIKHPCLWGTIARMLVFLFVCLFIFYQTSMLVGDESQNACVSVCLSVYLLSNIHALWRTRAIMLVLLFVCLFIFYQSMDTYTFTVTLFYFHPIAKMRGSAPRASRVSYSRSRLMGG